jgi:putative resolvase
MRDFPSFHPVEGLTSARKTAYRWFRTGCLPVTSLQNPKTGTILIEDPGKAEISKVALYAPVSSHEQKADIDR